MSMSVLGAARKRTRRKAAELAGKTSEPFPGESEKGQFDCRLVDGACSLKLKGREKGKASKGRADAGGASSVERRCRCQAVVVVVGRDYILLRNSMGTALSLSKTQRSRPSCIIPFSPQSLPHNQLHPHLVATSPALARK